MIKLCIFDMDGLLIDSERYMWMKTLRQAMAEQGFNMSEEFHKSIMGRPLNEQKDKFVEKFGPTFDYDLLVARMEELNNHIINNGGVPLMKGARVLLDYLKAHHIHTAIGTTTIRREFNRIVKVEGLEDDIDYVVCGDEVSKGKPDPEIYLKCFEKFNIDKSEAIIIEDGNAGSHAALSSGIRLVIVPDIATLDDEVRSKAYATLNDLSEAIDLIEKENETALSI